jgi:hypothetical protein
MKTGLNQFWWFTKNWSVQFENFEKNKKLKTKKPSDKSEKLSDKSEISIGLLFSIQNLNFK